MGETLPAVTVAIPVFNSAATLVRAIRSAAGQTLENIEILVADDGSTDEGAALAEAEAAADDRIRVIRMGRNGGKPRAMNRMVEEARGRWVAVLDADDVFLPDRLERLVGAAEAAGAEMAADNLLYYDAGVDRVLRTGFDRATGPRILRTEDLLGTADSFAEFDYGILKPVVRRDFVLAKGIRYHEETRLAEDFYYLLEFFAAGGRTCLLSEALYRWTLPFGTVSRRWTGTGSGAWRYDYRQALKANEHFTALMRGRGEERLVAMLRSRGRQYRVMIPYLDAQRRLAEGRAARAAAIVATHPTTWPLLLRRVIGRLRRAMRPVPGMEAITLPHATRNAP